MPFEGEKIEEIPPSSEEDKETGEETEEKVEREVAEKPEEVELEKEKIEEPLETEREKIMEVPKIVVQPEKGAYLLSATLKGCNPEWGNRNHELAKLTERHFEEHPLNPEIKNTIDTLKKEGVDEETLYNLSLTYQHPERTEYVFDMLEKHKDIERGKAEELQQKLTEVLGILDNDPLLDSLEKNFVEETQKDIKIRQEQLEGSRQRIEKLIDFFRPKSKTTPVKRINLMPTDFLYHERSGKSFTLGEELILMSPLEDSTDGQAHEFLHSVINPIVDKLDQALSEDQKKEIVQLSSGKLRQHYGEKYCSLLCEGFIRTYINIFEKGKKPPTYKHFKENLSRVATEEQFQGILATDRELEQRCQNLGISDLKGLIEKSKSYFEMYEKNQLGEIVYSFYQNYQRERSKKPEATFEDFVLEKFNKYLEFFKKTKSKKVKK